MVRRLVHMHGTRSWTLVAQHLPGRTGKQCRERWHNHLDPSINKGPWSEEEDRVLKAGVEETTGENGTKDWEAVGTLLQQAGFFRTGKQARHRYARILNGQKKPGRNKCLICGQPKKGHSCSGSPSIVATGLSAAQIRKGRASAARRTAKVNEAKEMLMKGKGDD